MTEIVLLLGFADAIFGRREVTTGNASVVRRLAFGLPFLLIELFYIGMPAARTDGRSLTLSVYGHVITKFSRAGRLPHFLSHGAPPTRGAKRRAWNSAKKDSWGSGRD